jgi:CBS domain-containing membrane protein
VHDAARDHDATAPEDAAGRTAAARHLREGMAALTVIDTVAVGLIIGTMVWIDQVAAPQHLPFLIASFASSTVVLFAVPGLDIARSWNVIGGQFFGGLSGFVAASLIHGHLGLAAGCAVALAFVLMRLTGCLHPPGAATALIVAIQPLDHGARFLLFPVLAGAVTIVFFAWAVHLVDRFVLARFTRGGR